MKSCPLLATSFLAILIGLAPVAVAAQPVEGTQDEHTDHDQVLGHVGVGFLGLRDVSIPSLDPETGEVGMAVLDAPVVGVRYWFNETVGLDIGFGLGIDLYRDDLAGPSNLTEGSSFAGLIHLGLPIALTTTEHFCVEFVPETNLGVGRTTEDAGSGGHGGDSIQLDVGFRVGAEIQFGFMDIPHLSLQAGVGLRLSYVDASYEHGDSSLDEFSRFGLHTRYLENPWNILTANVAALYYF